MSASIKKKVAVIGAGCAGLGIVKSLKEENVEPVCFEKTGDFGGLWCYREDENIPSVMKSTITNTSKELGAISDFPPPKEYPNYMSCRFMYEYFRSAIERFGLLKHINFHHEVTKITPADDYEATGKWVVTTRNTKTNKIENNVFAGVMVATGHHVFPNVPTFPGEENFKGKIIHSNRLKKVNGYEDQNVVVVGGGTSGVDAACEISNVAKQVYLSCRRGTWVVSRLGPKGYPVDTVYIRRWIHLIASLMPFSLLCSLTERMLNERFDHRIYNLKPKHRVLSQHATVNDALPLKLLSGKVEVRGEIKQFTTNGVIFNGEDEEILADTVIFATGYCIKFPFLSNDILTVKENRVLLYKFIYPPHLQHGTLAIIGLIQPNGPGIPVGEIQCRWAAKVMSGKCKLPSKEVMLSDIRAKEKANRKVFVNSPRHTIEVGFVDYLDELATLIGAKPNLLKLLVTDPKLFWAVFTGPVLPYQYRLQGPNTWSGAREAILTYEERILTPLKKSKQHECEKQSDIFISITAVKVVFVLFIVFIFISLTFPILFQK